MITETYPAAQEVSNNMIATQPALSYNYSYDGMGRQNSVLSNAGVTFPTGAHFRRCIGWPSSYYA